MTNTPPVAADLVAIILPVCARCFWVYEWAPRPVCTAFPTGIPEDVLLGRNDHSAAIEGDHGIRFLERGTEAQEDFFLKFPGPDTDREDIVDLLIEIMERRRAKGTGADD